MLNPTLLAQACRMMPRAAVFNVYGEVAACTASESHRQTFAGSKQSCIFGFVLKLLSISMQGRPRHQCSSLPSPSWSTLALAARLLEGTAPDYE